MDGVRFEGPSRFRHLPRLSLRYASWDRSRLLLVDPHAGEPLANLLPQDKHNNASGHRRALEPVAPPQTTTAATTATGKELPARVRKWLADYAATGLPPAYLPTDEQRQEGPHGG